MVFIILIKIGWVEAFLILFFYFYGIKTYGVA